MESFKEYPLNRDYLVGTKGTVYGWWKGKTKRRKLKPSMGNSGYKTCKIIIGGKTVSKPLHRMIAETFLQNPDEHSDVDHINGIKTDNRLENLQWMSHRDNCKKANHENHAKKSVVSINCETNEVMLHDSISDAGRWLCKKRDVSLQSVVPNIISGIKTGRMRYGCMWSYV